MELKEKVESLGEVDIQQYFKNTRDLQQIIGDEGESVEINERAGRYIIRIDYRKAVRDTDKAMDKIADKLNREGYIIVSVDWSSEKDRVSAVVK